MAILLFVLTLFYLGLLLWLSLGLRRLENSKAAIETPDKNLPTVALVVCAKNEERRLPRLLRALSQQDFPSGKLEICLVDDRSTDRTGAIIEKFAITHSNVIHLRIDDTVTHFAPKKRAIDMAIRHTTGEIILLTDADAEPGPRWIHEMARAFKPNVVMVCGYSPYLPRQTCWQKIWALEYFSHAAVAAGGIGLGRPLTCTGSNMTYRRDAYLRIGGFNGIAHWISGDDDLLLHKMHKARIGKILYAAHPAAHAPARPPNTWKEFHSQRTRYASKSLHYEPALTLSLGLVFLLNVLICAGLFSVIFAGWKFFVPTLFIGLLKATGEYLFLRRAAKLFSETKLLAVFPIAALLHPFYVVYFATRGPFAKFNWRGEKFTARKNPITHETPAA
jgi:cellulose synthase/poly-beta-1,6-N-acetylglucosamine synthase-like glycosyltransferase